MELDNVALIHYLTQHSGAPVQLTRVSELGHESSGAAALKGFGYGRPLLVEYVVPSAASAQARARRIVMRQIKRNGFGRERDDDRIAEAWLDFATFNDLPQHVHVHDIVALREDGTLRSECDVREFVLVTEYAPGAPYAEDLFRIRESGRCTPQDIERAAQLATYLATIHTRKHTDALLWRRRLRDLIGDGEGIMGLTESYAPGDTIATPQRLQNIEAAANLWRWRLLSHTHRLSQVHGDFHPFNVLFDAEGQLRVLDRSRGAWGEPADDVSCMVINYLFFGLQRDGALVGAFARLYETFWERYLHRTQDRELLSVIAPWFAWRALVLASPQWYPNTAANVRQNLLHFAQAVLAQPRFQWQQINSYIQQ